MTTFDPKAHFQNLSKGGQPRWYLPTEARINWFRSVHPLGGILVHADPTTGLVYATVHVDGVEIASDIATVREGKGQTWAGRELEKAATAAIGRALKNAGFGTLAAMTHTGTEGQADDEDGELDYLADAPVEQHQTNPSASAKRTNPYTGAAKPTVSHIVAVETKQKRDGKGVFYQMTLKGGKTAFAFTRKVLEPWAFEEDTTDWNEVGFAMEFETPIPVYVKLTPREDGDPYLNIERALTFEEAANISKAA